MGRLARVLLCLCFWGIVSSVVLGTGTSALGSSAGSQLAVPGPATQISPSGTIGTNTPAYTWNAVSGSLSYCLWVNDSTGTRISQWYTAIQAGCGSGTGTCTITPTTALAPGAAQWWVQTLNLSGAGPWSLGMAFTVPTPAKPGKAVLISPSGSIGTNIPVYTWNAVSGSTWYWLWVSDSTGNKVSQWVSAEGAGCGSGTGTCTATPNVALAAGAAQWWVQTWNAGGYGPWSDGMAFVVPAPVMPGKVTLIWPSGQIATTTPTYTWNADAHSTWYYLWVDDATGNRIQKWYSAADASCATGTGQCHVTPSITVKGAAQWWVATWSPNGSGPWSTPLSFTSPMPSPPGAATLVSPSGSISTTQPTYTWNAVSDSTWYYLWVDDSSGVKVLQWYSAGDAGCASGTGQCSVTPDTELVGPGCTWWIQTWNSQGGSGSWSAPLNFTVPTTMTGTWNGTWTSSQDGESGDIKAALVQSGESLSGTVDLTNTDAGDISAPVTGTVSGSSFSVSGTYNYGGHSYVLTVSGNLNSGSSASGTYTTSGYGHYDTGVFSMVK